MQLITCIFLIRECFATLYRDVLIVVVSLTEYIIDMYILRVLKTLHSLVEQVAVERRAFDTYARSGTGDTCDSSKNLIVRSTHQ